MREIIIIFTLLTSLSTFAQDSKGSVIHFKDGSTKVGYFKYGSPFRGNILITDKLKFRTNKKNKDFSEYDFSEISKIVTPTGNTYYYLTPKDNLQIILKVSLVYEGSIKIYRHQQLANGGGPNSNIQYMAEVFYLQKGEESLVHVFPNKTFGASPEKLMKNFFKDCPKLVQLIDRQAFKIYVANNPDLAGIRTESRLIEIVKYYDTKCIEDN